MGAADDKTCQGSCSPIAPSTPPKQQEAVAQNSRSRSPSPTRKPWVVADWKHRVPVSEICGARCRSPAPRLHTEQRAAQLAERKRQLAAEFSVAYDTIDQLLDRCKLVQDTLHVNTQGKCRSRLVAHSAAAIHSSRSQTRPGSNISSTCGSSNRQPSPARPTSAPHSQPHAQSFQLYASARSQLMTNHDTSQGTAQHSTRSGSSNGNRPSSGSSRRPGHMAVTPLCSEQQHQADSAQHGPWDGAVDLNPGFSFRPGTPERTAAVLRHAEEQAVMTGDCTGVTNTAAAAAGSVAPAQQAVVYVPGLCYLTHRENLQAGIQQLTGACYEGIRQQQWQQHQQQLQQLGGQAEVIPVTWFGVCV